MKFDNFDINHGPLNILLEDEIRDFINQNTDDPTNFSSCLHQLWSPFFGWKSEVLIVRHQEDLVSIIVFKYKKYLFYNFSHFQYITKKQYEKKVAQSILYYMFEKLNSDYVLLYMPTINPDLTFVNDLDSNIKFKLEVGGNHSEKRKIIPIASSWDTFKRNRGGSFRKRFRYAINRLSKEGTYLLKIYDKNNIDENMLEDILQVEKNSWKDDIRNGEKDDFLLGLIYDIYDYKIPEDFKWDVILLYINDEPAAYSLNGEFRNRYYIIKSSYDKKYIKYGPGIFVINESVKNAFQNKDVKLIDFITNLDFTKIWGETTVDNYQYKFWKSPIFSLLHKLQYKKIVI